MDRSFAPRQIAILKDKILNKLCTEGSPQKIDDLYLESMFSRLILVNHIQEEPRYFIYTPEKFIAIGQTYMPVTVAVTIEEEYFYRHTNGFVGIFYTEVRLKAKENRRKKIDILSAIVLVVFTGLAAYGSINNKLLENKEERLEAQISIMN